MRIIVILLLVISSAAFCGLNDLLDGIRAKAEPLRDDLDYKKVFVCGNGEEIEDQDLLTVVVDYVKSMNEQYPLALGSGRTSAMEGYLKELDQVLSESRFSKDRESRSKAYNSAAGILNQMIDKVLLVEADTERTKNTQFTEDIEIAFNPDGFDEMLLMNNQQAEDEISGVTREPERELRSAGKVNVSGANVRKGPGTGYSVITTLSYGTTVTITGKSGNWFKVTLQNGTNGYIYSDLVKETGDSGTDNSGEAPKMTGSIKVSAANVRKGPSTSYSIITTLSNGEKVTIHGTQSGWYNVTIPDGRKGFISATLVAAGSDNGGNDNGGNDNGGGGDNNGGNDNGGAVSGKAAEIVKAALGAENQSDVIYGVDCYTATTEWGNLACAAVVSAILKKAGAASQVNLACVGLRDYLKTLGYSTISNQQYAKGDVCYWTKTSGDRPRHTGVIVSQDVYSKWWTIDNSSGEKKVLKRPLIRSYYPIILPTQRVKS